MRNYEVLIFFRTTGTDGSSKFKAIQKDLQTRVTHYQQGKFLVLAV